MLKHFIMYKISTNKLRLHIQHPLFVFLLIVSTTMVGVLAYQWHFFWDATDSHRNSVSEPTNNILANLPGNIIINAFVTDDSNYRNNIKNFIARFQHSKSNIQLTFTSPHTDPSAARHAATTTNGELVISYEKRSERLRPPYSEQEVTNLLARLSRTHQQQIMLLTGHGERDFYSANKQEFGSFAEHLREKGFSFSAQDLNTRLKVPFNSTMLVIAAPTKHVPQVEVERIKTLLDSGENLLWLLNDNDLQGLDKIADYIGLEVPRGIVINKEASQLGGDPKLVMATHYADHPITDHFRMRTSYYAAHQIKAHGTYENGWQVQDLIHTNPNGWLETNLDSVSIQDKPPVFDQEQDIDGPINIGVVLERKYAQKGQRVVVIGNANFLDNNHLVNDGNREIGYNIVNWLAGDDSRIQINRKPLKDEVLLIDPNSHYKLIFLCFQFLVPLGSLIFGLVFWWKRKRS